VNITFKMSDTGTQVFLFKDDVHVGTLMRHSDSKGERGFCICMLERTHWDANNLDVCMDQVHIQGCTTDVDFILREDLIDGI